MIHSNSMTKIDFDEFPLVALEKLVNARFSVCAERSLRPYEEFTMPDGEIVRLIHYVFGYLAKGRLTEAEKVSTMAKHLWDAVKSNWPPGTFLMWRRMPVLSEYEEAPDDWRIKLSLRIGSFVPPLDSEVAPNMRSIADGASMHLID